MAQLAPPPARGALPAIHWLWRVQALLAAYLPLLLMAVLASGTWWLVKNTPMADGPMVAVAPRHEPDYRMQGFQLQRMGPDGRLRASLIDATTSPSKLPRHRRGMTGGGGSFLTL